jgi:hypothetical protein
VPAIRKDGSTISVEFTVNWKLDGLGRNHARCHQAIPGDACTKTAARSALESTIDMSPWCKDAPIFTSRVPAV